MVVPVKLPDVHLNEYAHVMVESVEDEEMWVLSNIYKNDFVPAWKR